MCSQEVSLSNQSYVETGLCNRPISATHKGDGAWLEASEQVSSEEKQERGQQGDLSPGMCAPTSMPRRSRTPKSSRLPVICEKMSDLLEGGRSFAFLYDDKDNRRIGAFSVSASDCPK